jgi:DNA invertase Pin-like site-specific DNA recombinase
MIYEHDTDIGRAPGHPPEDAALSLPEPLASGLLKAPARRRRTVGTDRRGRTGSGGAAQGCPEGTQQLRAIGYVQVSTAGQAADGVSLDAQRSKIEAWCEVNDYRLVAVHSDAGLSGSRADNRPGLCAALDAACNPGAPGKGGALVVYSLSRLARSTTDAIAIADRLHRAGADLVSLSERIDTTTAAGKMVFRMLAVLAEFERDLVSERTTAALSLKRANGQRVGTVPYGFDLAADGSTLIPNEAEQAVIADIRAMRAARTTLEAIADNLTARRVPTKTGRSTRWTHQAVARILKRPAS